MISLRGKSQLERGPENPYALTLCAQKHTFTQWEHSESTNRLEAGQKGNLEIKATCRLLTISCVVFWIFFRIFWILENLRKGQPSLHSMFTWTAGQFMYCRILGCTLEICKLSFSTQQILRNMQRQSWVKINESRNSCFSKTFENQCFSSKWTNHCTLCFQSTQLASFVCFSEC